MRCALIGKTLGHSYSGIIHEKFGYYGYDLVELEENQLEKFVKEGKYDGFNVTIPYKTAIIKYLDKLDPIASETGAVNTVVRTGGKTYGYNTDVLGMAYMLKKAGISLAGKNVVICGSGGTGKTAEYVAKKMNAAKITVVSRKGENNYSNVYSLVDTQVIINATPVGMYPYNDVSLLDLKKFSSLEAVADVIYNPLLTRLALDAKKLGIKYTGGLIMLVAQAKFAMDIFIKRRSPDELISSVYAKILKQTQNIVLVGMPGSGKTSVGKAVAKKLMKKYVDSDAAIVEKAGCPVSEIFEKYGEKHFRSLEKQMLAELGKAHGTVISTGGGAVLDAENYYSLKQNGLIYYLERPADALATRGRPLSKNKNAIAEMERVRLPLYREYADKTIENDGDFFACVKKIAEDFYN